MMKLRFLKGAMLALTLTCGAATTFANDDTMSLSLSRNAEAMGTLRGRVVDAEKNFLAGAAVYVKELNRGVATDANGFYTLPAIQVGTYNVEVSYVGYNLATESVTIKVNETVIADIEMKDATTIDNVVVTSVMKDQARALSTQKSALNMMDVISSDQASKYPDSNIGDALKRISGINVQYDQGEARFGQVRGTPAEMTSVTINGNRMPSAEDGTRCVQLDLIPADMVQTIEVNKVVTPDMDGDAIGGSVNLITKNSPSRQIATANVGAGYDMIGGKLNPNFGVTYGNVTKDGKFGYILSASYLNNHLGSDNTEFEWVQGEDGKSYVDDYQIRQYYVQRERQSYSASFNYNINKNHKLDFKGLYNRRNDWENRYRTRVKDLTKDMDEDGYGMNGKISIETKGGSDDVKNTRLERQQTMDFTLGGEHLFGKIMMDWSASWAKASEERPDERYVSYELNTSKTDGIVMDLSDVRQPYAMRGDGGTIALTDEFGLGDLSESNKEVSEIDQKYKVDFKLPLSEGQNNSSLTFGTKITLKEKKSETFAYDYLDAADEAGYDVESSAFANTSLQDRDGFMPGSKYNYGRTFTTKEWLGDLNFKDETKFDQPTAVDSQILEESAGNYNASENVYAAYLRYDKKLGRNVDLMAGLRMEHTFVKYSGYTWGEWEDSVADEDGETLEPTGEYSSSYTNFLPSVMVKWDAKKDLRIRASFTNTLARPNYEDLVPNMQYSTEDGVSEVTVGNPELKSTLSYNVDLSADYYFKSIGLIRGGIFYKRINDFIVEQRLSNYVYEGDEYAKFTQTINGGNANLLGFEAVYQRDLGFISPSLKFMGVSGTYTYTYTDVADFNVEGRENDTLSLPGSPEHTANASIYAEKKGLTIRLSYNYASSFIDELGESSYYDRFYDSVNYLDLNVNYTFKKKFNVYADVTNLTNQPLRYYQGDKDRTMQVEYYGPRFNAGFKVTF